MLLLATPMSGDALSIFTLQSGSPTGSLSIHARGLYGQNQLIAVLDSGLDYDNCAFAEADNSPPPINTGTPAGGFARGNIDLSRRKVVAYNFLFSCDQYPGVPGCDDPADPLDYDNVNHGTRTAGAAAGDRFTPLVHDAGDGVAPAAKLIIQDAGYVNGDSCSQFPSLGCPITKLSAAFEQAYQQGARIHSNSWGDRQGVNRFSVPPTANYSATARDVDLFAAAHPEMLIVFNAGNAGDSASTVSSPGTAKNVLQVGGTGDSQASGDETLFRFSGAGPTRDGRIKPDLVGPAMVEAPDAYSVYVPSPSAPSVTDRNCDASIQGGTSYASPFIAGAAALVRQYFTEGFYPSGARSASDRLTPTSALLKATLIAGTRSVLYKVSAGGQVTIAPAPSGAQGFGFPVLDDVLYFAGERSKLHVVDRRSENGLASAESFSITLNVRAGTRLKAALVWIDPAGTARGATDPTPVLVNDLDLIVTMPDGTIRRGNETLHPGQPDRLNNVEVVGLDTAAAGAYRVTVTARTLGQGARQGFALVVSGDLTVAKSRRRAAR
ncbi:MAG TPA: S8 family serine peptidase [Thermoanaerobaculia bacterium]|nr:S8 family serine peptidase [Thermoanaerobaculia bacterium]